MLPKPPKQYSPLPSADGDRASSEAFLSKTEDESDDQPRPVPLSTAAKDALAARTPWHCHSTLFLLLFCFSAYFFSLLRFNPSDKACAEQLGSYCKSTIQDSWRSPLAECTAPAYDAVEYYDLDWQNAFDEEAHIGARRHQTENSCGLIYGLVGRMSLRLVPAGAVIAHNAYVRKVDGVSVFC